MPACRQEGYLGGNPPTLPARGWYIVSVEVTGLMIDPSGLGIAVRRHCSSWLWPMITSKTKPKSKIVVMVMKCSGVEGGKGDLRWRFLVLFAHKWEENLLSFRPLVQSCSCRADPLAASCLSCLAKPCPVCSSCTFGWCADSWPVPLKVSAQVRGSWRIILKIMFSFKHRRQS